MKQGRKECYATILETNPWSATILSETHEYMRGQGVVDVNRYRTEKSRIYAKPGLTGQRNEAGGPTFTCVYSSTADVDKCHC